MGRYYWNRKATVEECESISIQFLKKHGYLNKKYSFQSGSITWSRCGNKTGSVGFSVENQEKINFRYTSTDRDTGEKKEKDYMVKLTKTPCNLGGVRYWFECPFCNRRVGVLHLLGKSDFACRHCLNLSYDSRNQSGMFSPGQ